MARHRKKKVLSKPPRQFPKVIKLHACDFEPGLGTCLLCGQKLDYRLHIRPHVYSPNYDSKRSRCMCGLNQDHPLHKKGN